MRYEISKEEQQAIDKWLAEGNKAEVCTPGERTEPDNVSYSWGRKKKKAPEAPEAPNAK